MRADLKGVLGPDHPAEVVGQTGIIQWKQDVDRDESPASRVELDTGRSKHQVQIAFADRKRVEGAAKLRGAEVEDRCVTKRPSDDVADNSHPWSQSHIHTARVVEFVRRRDYVGVERLRRVGLSRNGKAQVDMR